MTLQEKKKTTIALGLGSTILFSLLSNKYTTEIAIVGASITILATYIIDNLKK